MKGGVAILGRAPGGYAGNVAPAEAFRALRDDPSAALIDVRSQSEWAFVGLPDLSALGKQVCLIEWQRFPQMERNPDFLALLRAALFPAGVRAQEADRALFFLCRSGQRSAAAAGTAAQELKLAACYNIADGFEGPLDAAHHRGGAGWKACGLPWVQR